MLKIAITGSTGLIGSRIIELLKDDFEFIELIWPQFDVAKKDQVWRNLKNLKFDIFFHLAAYTNVDTGDQEKKLAYSINVTGTKNVFEIVRDRKKKFIYVSTDFIFDGKHPPYYENSKPNPLSYYAQTKYEGEKIVNPPAGGQTMIVRYSYPYRAGFEPKRDFVRTVKHLLGNKKTLLMVTDSLITPTFIDDIVFAMKYLFTYFSPEIYHIVGGDSLSPYDAGKLIAKTFRLDTSLVQPISYKEYFKNKAKRPQYSEIKTKRNNFQRMKKFAEGLTEVATQLHNF